MKKNKEDEFVLYLKQEQNRIQDNLQRKIDFNYQKNNWAFGIWITARCGKCGHDFKTVFYIPQNGKCPNCKKKIYGLLKVTKNKKVER